MKSVNKIKNQLYSYVNNRVGFCQVRVYLKENIFIGKNIETFEQTIQLIN